MVCFISVHIYRSNYAFMIALKIPFVNTVQHAIIIKVFMRSEKAR